MLASAVMISVAGLFHLVDKIGFGQEGASHLYEIEVLIVEHLVSALPIHYSTDIYQREIQLPAEESGIIEEV